MTLLRQNHSIKIFITSGLLLLIGLSRLHQQSAMMLNPDEVWAVWQTVGTPDQIIRWSPYDWPPLYFLVLGSWRGLVGQHPVLLRYFSILLFLLGTAFLYRAARRLTNSNGAWLASLSYAALGYAALLSLEVRGYALMLLLTPLAFWLLLRYFDHPRPGRGLLLGLALAAMFYTSLASVGAFVMFGIYTLIVYRQKSWRWWLPGLTAAVLALLEILAKANLIDRTAATLTLKLPPLPEALYRIFWEWTGYPLLIWVGLLLLALALLGFRRELQRRQTLALLFWVLGAPVMMYLSHPLIGFFSARYSWWIMMGIALLLGSGLAWLPPRLTLAPAVILILLLFNPVPLKEYSIFENLSELGRNFTWLQTRMIPGDVFITDANNQCGKPEEWDYYLRTYFPTGLTFLKHPGQARRVWHIVGHTAPDMEQQREITDGRIYKQFNGPPGCQFRLYEAPPDPTGILFENGLRFHGADVIENDLPWMGPLVKREGETLHLRLWWSVEEPLPLDYSVGLYLTRQGELLDSTDSAPQVNYPPDAPAETSQWQPGGFYIENRELTLPYPTPRSITYEISLAVYFWQDGKRIPAPGVNTDGLLPLYRIPVMSW